jgi:glucosamine 6-phosphate synthetase-like amidotransferase/phosphosugar isomerase protein
MCGICGYFNSPGRQTATDRELLRDVFTRLLVANEVRGPYATGVATITNGGRHRLFKRPIPAQAFVREVGFARTMAGISANTTVVMGHTRYPTVGDMRQANLQPMRIGTVSLNSHNGHIFNHDALAAKFHLPRTGQTDSEVLFRLAASVYHPQDWLPRMAEILGDVEGTLACVMVAQDAPHQALILRRGRPLELAWLPELGAIIYTSDIIHLTAALDSLDWRSILLADGEGGLLDVRNMPEIQRLALPPDPMAERAYDWQRVCPVCSPEKTGRAANNE